MIQESPDLVEKALDRLRAVFGRGDECPWRKWLLFIVMICTMGAVSARAATQTMTYDAQGNLIASVSSTAVAPPTIIAQPVGQLAQLGSLISFSVVAAGTAPLSFQWLFNGNPISTVTNPTAGTATLVLSSLAPGDFGAYSVTVSNSANSVTSAPAQLQLDSVGDGIPDSWKAANFGAGWATNPNSLASADPDADGFTNAEEYADGTDPNNAAAHFFRLTIASGNVAVQPAAPRYAPGSVVTLTALPSGDLQFTSFSTQDLIANTAAVTTTANPLVLTLNTNYSVSAVYGVLPLEQSAVIPSFTVNNHNARAEAFLTQTDGKLVVAGAFDAITGVAHSNIARFNTDGSLDASFTTNASGGGIVNIVQQTDGKLLIAGYFNAINSVARSGLARLNTDGSLDTTFTANSDNFVRQVAYRGSDGMIVAVGGFSHVNGVLSVGVVRLNAVGTVDTSFAVGSGANNTVYSVVWQPDGNVVIGGDFTSFNSSTVNRLARLTSTGAVDSTFTASADSTVFQIVRRPSDGDLWVAGGFGVIDGVTRRGLARLRASDGTLDASVNVGAGLVNGGVGSTGLALQADGKVVIGGNFAGYNGSTQYGIARVNADGSLDAAYTPGGTGLDNQVIGVFLDGAGNTLIGGYFNFINGVPHLGVARLLAGNGNLDATFTANASFFSQVYAVTPQSNGAILAGGPFNVANGIYRSHVARLLPDGTLDTAFNAGLGCDNYVDSIAVGSNGKVVIGGGFSTVNGLPNQGVARFNPDGSLDSGFQSTGGVNNEVTAVAVQRDGKVLLGGYFTAVRGAQRRYMARLNADGTLDSDFAPVADARVRTILVQPDTKILLGGEFTNVNGVATGGLARLDSDGSLDANFTLPLPNNFTAALVLQPDGKILAGGRFTTLLSGARIANRLARFNSDGTIDPGFNLGANFGTNGDINSLALQSDGHLVIGGNFVAVNNTNLYALARLNPDGSLDTSTSFHQAALGLNNILSSVAVQPSDAVLIGGYFTTVGGQSRPAYARFITAPGLQPGTITVSPAGPAFASGAAVSLSLTPGSVGAAISGVSFESSADGVNFQTLGGAAPGTAGAWTLPGVALPPGATYFRAVVTDQTAALTRSNIAGPLFTPPVVTGPLTATASAGLPISLQVNASGPLTGFTATGLPAGLIALFDANLGALLISGTPTTPGVSTVALAPANAAGSGAGSLTLTVVNRYDAWASQNFSTAELNDPNLSGPLGDATGAGIANLMKYALGIPPHAPGIPAGLPVAGIQRFGGIDYLTLSYTHDQSATDVALSVEVSGEIAIWKTGAGFTVEVNRTDNGNGTETVVTRDAIPQISATSRFIRLKAVQIEP